MTLQKREARFAKDFRLISATGYAFIKVILDVDLARRLRRDG